MARSANVATPLPEDQLSASEQAQLDQMQVDDGASPQDGGEGSQPGESHQSSGTDAAAGDDGQQQPARQQMVPHAALHEERERRKQTETQLTEEKRQRTLIEERTNLILQRFNQQQAPPPEQPTVPELDKDPLGHLLGLVTQQNSAISALTTAAQQNQQQNQQVQAIQQLQSHALALESEYRRTIPDYDAAAAHLRDRRDRELALAGFDNPGQRQAIMTQEALGIAARAMQQGKNPGEMIYELAKLGGYAGQQADAGQPGQETQPGQRIQQVAAGQQQSRSLSQVRGNGPVPMTAQRLVEMTDAEFAKALETPEGMALLGS